MQSSLLLIELFDELCFFRIRIVKYFLVLVDHIYQDERFWRKRSLRINDFFIKRNKFKRVCHVEEDSSCKSEKLIYIKIKEFLLIRESRWIKNSLRIENVEEKENSWIKAGRLKAGNINIKKGIYPRHTKLTFERRDGLLLFYFYYFFPLQLFCQY